MPKVTQLALNLQSKPGVLAAVARVLGDAGVNVVGLCAGETSGRGKIRLLVSDAARGREALARAKYRASEEAAITVALEDRPGALAAVADTLARARINIKCAYATTAGGGKVTLVITPSNADRALSVLGA